MHLEQLGQDQGDGEEEEAQHQNMRMKGHENGLPGEVAMLGDFAIGYAGKQAENGVEEGRIIQFFHDEVSFKSSSF